MIKSFYSHNKVLSWLEIASLLIVLLYTISINWPEWYPGIGKWFDLLNNICLAYIGSFLFYVIQVYIPEQKKKCSIDKVIKHNIDFIYSQHYVAKNDFETYKICLERDLNKFNTAHNRKIIYEQPKNESEIETNFLVNIERLPGLIDENLNIIEEKIDTIKLINVSVALSIDDFNNDIQVWIEKYYACKSICYKYHDGRPDIYFNALLKQIEDLKSIYPEECND